MAPPLPGDAEAGDDGAVPLLSPSGTEAPPMPRWYSPKRLLGLFCVMQYMVYMDRGVRACSRREAPPAPAARKPRDPAPRAAPPRRRRSSPAPA